MVRNGCDVVVTFGYDDIIDVAFGYDYTITVRFFILLFFLILFRLY
jgi:hypothetical protein